jgi:hydrogenase nickel incorporation protein HypA/HybF
MSGADERHVSTVGKFTEESSRNFSSVGELQPKIGKGGKSDCFYPAAKPVWQCCATGVPVEVGMQCTRFRSCKKRCGWQWRLRASRVLGLHLRVGTLSGAVPEAMRFAFDVVCRDTIAEGASLEIESVPAACWCAICRKEFECADFVSECPHCHNPSGDLRRGRELEIASVELN